MITDREKTLMAAAYLHGMARGIASQVTKAFHKRTKGSPLEQTNVFNVVDELMRDGLASNPIAIYEMKKMADECGFSVPHGHLACQMIQNMLTPNKA